MLVSDYDASKVAKPTESSLDCISSPVAIPQSIILPIDVSVVAPMWRKQVDAAFSEPLPERVAIVRLVADHSFGAGPRPSRSFLGDFDLLDRRFGEPDLCWRSRVGMASQRNTLAVDHNHALRSLPPLGLSDPRALFLPG